MTFAVLRRLHAIIGNALDEIEGVYKSHGYSTPSGMANGRKTPNQTTFTVPHLADKSPSSSFAAYVSPPPSPSTATYSESISTAEASNLDFPSLDEPCNPTSLSEVLTSDPVVLSAIGQIIAAAGQLTATVQTPFLTLCDAVMGYHLPSCMRLLEASHIVEILREAGSGGLHVDAISEKNGVNAKKLAHILRLLATHHILHEVSPDVFTLNRISSLVDSGKTFSELQRFQADGCPAMKYGDTNGIAAFVGLCTDELQKSAAYMTETYYLSPSVEVRAGSDPARAPFCFAFDTVKTKTGFFGWLEGEIHSGTGNQADDDGVETGPGSILPSVLEKPYESKQQGQTSERERGHTGNGKAREAKQSENPNKFRLIRFGKAMTGTDGWESPGAILNGFDWQGLPAGSVVVDVGGGIGSTSMLLATAFSTGSEADGHLKFIIQDRAVVCDMGENAWRAKCPELLESTAQFQAHDFFKRQPVRNAALFLLRVVLHDWPDVYAQQILLHLREAATPSTKLLIADFVLPLACPESITGLEDIEGAESPLVPAPLLPNLGKASSNVYWMDMTMQVSFNSQERTLRELVTLAASAGWRVTKVTRTPGSHFGYLVAVPMHIPEGQLLSDNSPNLHEFGTGANAEDKSCDVQHEPQPSKNELEGWDRASSRCGTPTFGSNLRLSSVQEALARFGGGIIRRSRLTKVSYHASASKEPPPVPLKPALNLSPGNVKKKAKPSALSVVTLQGNSTSTGPSTPSLFTPISATTPIVQGRRLSSTSPKQESTSSQPGQVQPQSPLPKKIVPRRLSFANLRSSVSQSQQALSLPTFSFTRQQPPASPRSLKDTSPTGAPASPSVPLSVLRRRGSHARLPHAEEASTGAQAYVVDTTTTTRQASQSGLLAPSFIPVRMSASQGGTVIGSSSPPSPLILDQRTVPRRSSFVHLSQPRSRMRSGTVAGTIGNTIGGSPSINRPFPVAAPLPPQSAPRGESSGSGLLLLGSRSRLEQDLPPLPCSAATDEEKSVYVPEFGTGNVLATAARFEKVEA